MKNTDHIHWGLYHVPSLHSVKDLLRRDAVNIIPDVLTILDQAMCEFGCDSLFEWLNSILQKGQQNVALIIHIMETLITFMLRRKAENRFSLADLQVKGGIVDFLLWQHHYLAY